MKDHEKWHQKACGESLLCTGVQWDGRGLISATGTQLHLPVPIPPGTPSCAAPPSPPPPRESELLCEQEHSLQPCSLLAHPPQGHSVTVTKVQRLVNGLDRGLAGVVLLGVYPWQKFSIPYLSEFCSLSEPSAGLAGCQVSQP